MPREDQRSSCELHSAVPFQQLCSAGHNTFSSLFSKADRGWYASHQTPLWFTRSYTCTLPSHWAKQTLGHNLVIAIAHHLIRSMHQADPVLSRSQNILACAQLQPRRRCSVLPLPSAFFHAHHAKPSVPVPGHR